MRIVYAALFTLILSSCGPEPKPAPAVKTEAPMPQDESNRFPKANLADSGVVGMHLMGQPFMPGGTLAHYKRGKTEFEMFVARLPSALDAAILLPDWRKALSGAKPIPSFGGYFGTAAGRPVFVFAKDAWIAGVAGLPEREAETQARVLAAQLP